MAKHINSIVITEIESNTRLDRYLVNSLNIPQGLVQKDLRKGLIRVNEKKISGSYRIQEEDIIQFAKEYSENKPKEKILPNKKDLELLKKSIIYSCDDFFIINKWNKIAVQGGSGLKTNLDDILYHGHLFKNRPLLVHRLDKDTSGILIFALNRKSAKYFSDLFSERKIEKIYEAVVIGEPMDNEGIFENHVEEDGKTYLAETKYKIIKRLPNDLTHIELRPTTGRKHQLRIHCKLNGLPILGDNKYYLPISKVYKNENNLLLHAKKIIFNDQNGVLVKVEAKLPKYFFNYI
jgi:23S rRNA pseudouridine955/2504/2580 synthase